MSVHRLSHPQGRRSRRRRDGRADRRALVNAGVPVVLFDLAAKEGDPNGIVAKALAGLAKLEPAPLASAERARPDRRGQLRPRPRAPRRLRPRDRGDRRADGLEARPLREDRAAPRAARDLRVEHVGPVDQRARRSAAGRAAPALLRHPLLQSAALHASGRADRAEGDRSGAPRRARDVRRHHARQGRRAREGHAELHRQPRRHLLDAGDDGAHRDLQARLRRRRRADRSGDRPREERHVPHRRRRRASTRWRT